MTSRRRTSDRSGARQRHELPPPGTAFVRIIGANAADAEAVLTALRAAGISVLAEPDHFPAGPTGARTGTMIYAAVAVAADETEPTEDTRGAEPFNN